jgi:hypothetical protein
MFIIVEKNELHENYKLVKLVNFKVLAKIAESTAG